MKEFNYKDFNPKIHEKYSLNFYKNLKRWNKHFFCLDVSVYEDSDGVRWCGVIRDGDFIGSKLISLLCNPKEERYCHLYLRGKLKEVKNFWEDYKERGRCAIDTKHCMDFRNAKGRYSIEGDAKTCNWCGAKKRLKHRRRVVITSEWVNEGEKEVRRETT